MRQHCILRNYLFLRIESQKGNSVNHGLSSQVLVMTKEATILLLRHLPLWAQVEDITFLCSSGFSSFIHLCIPHIIQCLHVLFQKIKAERILPNTALSHNKNFQLTKNFLNMIKKHLQKKKKKQQLTLHFRVRNWIFPLD